MTRRRGRFWSRGLDDPRPLLSFSPPPPQSPAAVDECMIGLCISNASKSQEWALNRAVLKKPFFFC